MPKLKAIEYPRQWRTKRGKLTKGAARYLNQRTAEHYAYIRREIWGKL
jgi:hypothetical protein